MMPLPTEDQANVRPLQIIRILFFFQFAGIGIFVSFINVYLHDAGLNGTQIGLVGMLASLSGMLGATLWGYLSDRTARPRIILIIGALGTALVGQLYPLAGSFPGFAIIASLFGVFNSATNTLVDSLALSFLGNRRDDYGRYRLGGSFGFVLATSISGLVFERIGLSAMFPAFGLIGLAFILTASFLPSRAVQRQSPRLKSISTMIRQPVWLILISTVFLLWLASSGSFAFLNITIKNMGGSDSLVGFVFTTSALVEIPFMAYSGSLIRRFGASRLLWIAAMGYILRFFLYSQMGAPEWALGISAISGPMYVLFWNSTINVANQLAPSGLAATAQGLVVSTTSFAGVIGTLLSGWLFDLLGSSGLFMVLAGFCVLGFLLYSFSQIRLMRKPVISTE
jgi:PPP family 3-phenylpropionic acid transporter